jgi:hypothetical protein
MRSARCHAEFISASTLKQEDDNAKMENRKWQMPQVALLLAISLQLRLKLTADSQWLIADLFCPFQSSFVSME